MNSVAARLTKDHHELESLVRRLAHDARAPAPGALQTTWAACESRLIRHMNAEERLLLPLLEVSDPDEVARIRAEHTRIRDLLTELGAAIELHTVRDENIEELSDLLVAHAQREDGALYRLADDEAASHLEHGLARLLEHRGTAAASAISIEIDAAITNGRARS